MAHLIDANDCIRDLEYAMATLCRHPDMLNAPIEYGVKLGLQAAIEIIKGKKEEK